MTITVTKVCPQCGKTLMSRTTGYNKVLVEKKLDRSFAYHLATDCKEGGYHQETKGKTK